MSHKLLYLAIFTLFAASITTTTGNTDETTVTESSTDGTVTEGSTDETTVTESSTNGTTVTESSTNGTTVTEISTDGTTVTESSTDETTVTEGSTDETTVTESSTDETTVTEGSTDETTVTESSTDGTTETATTDATTLTTPPKAAEINVFFINDLHYHILPLDDEFQPCASDSCFGGLARLKKTLSDLNESEPIIINAGHSFDGELFNAFGFSAFKDVTTNLSFSAQVPSEDLYSFGLEAADNYISSGEANMVCANLNPKMSLELTTGTGCNISVIGFVEKSRIDNLHLANFTAEEEKSAVEAEVKKATGDIIIVVGSSSLEKAKEIATIEKVNVVLISGAEIGSDYWDQAGNYSYVGSLNVNDTDLDSIFRVRQLKFVMEDGCKLKSVANNLIAYKNSKEDDVVKASMAPYLHRLSVATKTDAVLNCSGEICLKSECAAGSLVADAIVLHFASDSKLPRLALVPGNVFSSLIVKDEVKGSDLYGMLKNFYLCSTVVKGSVLKQLFETSVVDYKNSESPMENYLQISGFFRVVYALENNKGKRVDQLQIFSSDSGAWQFEDVSDDKDYNVVIPADLREKTNVFNFLPTGTVLDVTMLDALLNYLSANGNQWLVPPLGLRIQYKQGSSSDNHNECYNNTGEVIILTLFVAGVISGLGIFLCKYVYPRYRARRGSTIHLIS